MNINYHPRVCPEAEDGRKVRDARVERRAPDVAVGPVVGATATTATTTATAMASRVDRAAVDAVWRRAMNRRRGERATDSDASTDDASTSGRALRRALSRVDILFLGVGGIVGAGVFVLTGEVASRRAGPGVAASYALAAMTSAITGLAYAEFATMMPEAGSSYSYAYAAFGEFGGVITGGNLVLELLIASAAIARGWTSYAAALVGASAEAVRLNVIEGVVVVDVVAGLVVGAMTALLVAGAKETARFNFAVTCASLLVIALVVVAGSTKIDVANWSPFAPYGVGGIISGAAVVIFSFVGFDTVATCAEEVADPSVDLPIGILGSLGICASLYVIMCLVITGMISYADIDVNAPFAVAFTNFGMSWVASFVSVGALAAITTSLLLSMMGQPRIFMVMARDGLLPPWFSRVSERFGTPANATIFSGIVTGVMAVLLDINLLAQLVSIGTLSVFCCVNLGILIVRCTPEDADWSRRTPPLRRALGLLLSSLAFGLDYRQRGSAVSWFGVLCLALVVVSTLSFLTLPVVAKSGSRKTFRAPMVPFLPAVGVLLTCVLIGGLGAMAWIRYIVYTLACTAAYVTFAWRQYEHQKVSSSASSGIELAETGAADAADADADADDVALLPAPTQSAPAHHPRTHIT